MTRKQYYTQIWQYKKRRIEAKKKCEAYKKVYKNLTKKISQWQHEINRIDARNEKLSRIYKKVNRYFHVDISERTNKSECVLARNIYYKMAIESKIQGKSVSEFIGRYKKVGGECRLTFTRSFSKYPEKMEAYHKFKKYFEN